MSRNAKIAIAFLAVVFVCCVCAGGVAVFVTRSMGQAFVTDPAELKLIAEGIAEYDLPPGYREQFGLRFLGFEILVIAPLNFANENLIMLMQIPSDARLSQAQLEAQIRQALQQQMDLQNLQLEVVGQTDVAIRGEPVTLTVREGTDADGRSIRQLSGLFQGKGGPTLIMIQGLTGGWDQATIDAFLASIR